MGIDLTSASPSNFLKDFPEQNANNCDAIDSFAGAQCLPTHALGTYTPLLTASSNPTLGTGTADIKGFYYKIFDWIWTWGYFRFGTGFAIGFGDYIITLPFPAKTNLPISANIGRTPVLGSGYLWDESNAAARQPLSVQLRSTTEIDFGIRMNSGAADIVVGHNLPITWAIDDGIKWSARYQRQS
jgi:hypothetical protein